MDSATSRPPSGHRRPGRRQLISRPPGGRPRPTGQALVEFALVLPVLLLLLLLAVDFGRLFFTYIAINNAAREAASYAAGHAGDASYDEDVYHDRVTTAALRETNAQAQGGTGTMTVSEPTCFAPGSGTTMDCDVASNFAGGIGNQVTVSVAQPFSFLTPLITDAFGGELVMTAAATAPVLNRLDVTILAGPPSAPGATPTPTPTPTPTATPTLPPGASPTPTPTPTPTPSPTPVPTCTVPDFRNAYWNNVGGIPALQVWHNEGFTGTLIDATDDHKIKSQTLAGGSDVACTSGMTVSRN